MSYLYPELPGDLEEQHAKRVEAYETALRVVLDFVADPAPVPALSDARSILGATFEPQPNFQHLNIPADTILGHVNNALAAVALAPVEGRVADGGEVNMWASISATDVERIAARLDAVGVFLSSLDSLAKARSELDEDDDNSLPF